eukprot:GEZU01024657.1.p1 GENE.GEZU01024657.1~~GEZU01024657.1.p1  ORF type:complete len:243 (-),score=58.44 GEZU01024657.1:137-865(-)
MFDSKDDVKPYLEKTPKPSTSNSNTEQHTSTSTTYEWCIQTAKKYNCFVVAGYPEVEEDTNNYYNSAVMVSPEGDLVCNYRKTYLYDTDKNWACEGSGFGCIDVKGIGKVGLGICMDLNPKDFVGFAYDFAEFNKAHQTKLVLLCANWLDSSRNNDDDDDGDEDDDDNDEDSSSSTHNYWAIRMRPLLGSNCIFAVVNRCGTERGTKFAGSSCVMRLGRPPVLLDALDKKQEALLVVKLKHF